MPACRVLEAKGEPAACELWRGCGLDITKFVPEFEREGLKAALTKKGLAGLMA